jgi:3-oxoacyl-[acyl-carrier-protein] synthase II
MRMREVVVTGIGAIAPVGVGVDAVWGAFLEGRSGVVPLSRFDPGDCPVAIAGEVPEFDTSQYVPVSYKRKLGRFAQLGLGAVGLAVADAQLEPGELDSDRAGTVLGSCYAGLTEIGQAGVVYEQRGWRAVSPFVGPAAMSNSAASAASSLYGIRGPVECVATSCATGAQAISRAFDLVRLGCADIVLAGGCDAPLGPVAVSAFATARALAAYAEDPASASRPFEASRQGFVLAEGAVVLVLEAAESAQARRARQYGRVLGWGHSADAYNMAQPRPDGEGAAAAMTAALRMAEIGPSDVGYVHAHATGTPRGDLAEALALHNVFPKGPPPVSSTKSMTGHMMGAAGSGGAAVALLALHHGKVPPTTNYDTPDPECDLDVVPNIARDLQPDVALSNAFALGGINCSLAFGRA